MSDPTQDVTPAETTAAAPSADNQTVETTPEVTPGDSKTTPETVPYERFAEVNTIKNELKSKIDQLEAKVNTFSQPATPAATPNPEEEKVKQQLDKMLKDMGYVSKTDLEQQRADEKLVQSIDKLSEKYNGKDGRPKFNKAEVLEYAQEHLIGDLELAYKAKHEADLISFAVAAALGKTKGVKSESSDGSGSSQVGTTQSDLLTAAQSGDKEAISALIKRTLH
jgi:hypothetical protein